MSATSSVCWTSMPLVSAGPPCSVSPTKPLTSELAATASGAMSASVGPPDPNARASSLKMTWKPRSSTGSGRGLPAASELKTSS